MGSRGAIKFITSKSWLRCQAARSMSASPHGRDQQPTTHLIYGLFLPFLSGCSAVPEYDDDFFTEKTMYDSGENLYPHHIPTTWLQKGLLAVGSGLAAFFDPKRDDMIAVLGESTGYLALKGIRRTMQKHPEGQRILREQPRINTSTINVSSLRCLTDGTFGKEYTKFLDKNKVTPDTRRPVRFIDDPELAYVMQRYREMHDFTHTLLGMPTNIVGEITVKWFEMVQTGLPMCTFGSFLAPIRLNQREQQKLAKYYVPWALYTGFRADFLMNLYVEKYLEEPIDTLRQRLNIILPPVVPKSQNTSSN